MSSGSSRPCAIRSRLPGTQTHSRPRPRPRSGRPRGRRSATASRRSSRRFGGARAESTHMLTQPARNAYGALMTLNHIGLTVGDLDKAIDFYTTVFGLTLLVGAETATRETAGADRRAEGVGERW